MADNVVALRRPAASVNVGARGVRILHTAGAQLHEGRCFASALDHVGGLLPTGEDAGRWKQTVRALGRLLGPIFSGQRVAGLCVAPVQSGKTLIQQGLATFACDNGAWLVIVLCSTKNEHLEQTRRRFADTIEHLRRHDPDNPRAPLDVSDDTARGNEGPLERVLTTCLVDPNERTALACILKNRASVDRLRRVINRVLQRHPTSRPVLIIDDESDHAGANTHARQVAAGAMPPGKISKIHESIVKLYKVSRAAGLAMFTATPAANLLALRGSPLEPEVAIYAHPGKDYCGLQAFFGDPARLCRPVTERGLHQRRLPGSARAALHYHLLACAMGVTGGCGQCFMEVRPSMLIEDHDNWRRAIVAELSSIARDLRDGCTAGFAAAHADMAKTVPGVPALDSILVDVVALIGKIEVFTSNSKSVATQGQWKARFGIVVGGANLDRAKTIPGLTVTYIASDSDCTPTDSMHQRGRMFGYRADYLDACRVWLPPAMQDAFVATAGDEQRLAEVLLAHGDDLGAWMRDLGKCVRAPTRTCVQGILVARQRGERQEAFNSLWYPGNMFATDAMIAHNRAWLDTFLADINGRPAPGEEFRYTAVPMQQVCAFLAGLQVGDHDMPDLGKRIDFLSGGQLSTGIAEVLMMGEVSYRSRTGSERDSRMLQYVSRGAGFEDGRNRGRVFLRLSYFDLGTGRHDKSSSDILHVPWMALRIPFAQADHGGTTWREVIR